MTLQVPSFTLGIEEEYLLVNLQTLDLENDPPTSLLEECRDRCHHKEQVSRELLRSQIEVGTRKSDNIHEAREDLVRLRRVVTEVSANHGLAPIAVSTHPFARWLEQKQTERDRYSLLSSEMQAAARRMMVCGMHVHVGIDDDELRIDLLSQMTYFLPHLLALSTSSPFWEGEDTGLKSYRLTVLDGLPRTGLPEFFSSFGEYQRHVEILVNANLIEDSSMIWWDLRPSSRYPTLETRIFDMCTDIDDSVCLAAMTLCISRCLYRLRLENQRWRRYNRVLINENRWRAMRYGTDEGLLDLAKGEVVDFGALLDEIIDLIAEDAIALDCVAEVEHVRVIMQRGTSAHRQLSCYEDAVNSGANKQEALREVVKMLIDLTQQA